MKYQVQVKPNSRQAKVEVVGSSELKVWVNAPAQEGKANERLVEILAEYFGVPKRAIRILVGASGRKKIVEIE